VFVLQVSAEENKLRPGSDKELLTIGQ